jgi:hypothetical protein
MELPAAIDDARKVVRRMINTHTLALVREWTSSRCVGVGVSKLAPRLFGLLFTKDVHSKELVIATQSKCKQILLPNLVRSIKIFKYYIILIRYHIYLGGIVATADEATAALGALYRYGLSSETPFTDITDINRGNLFFPFPYTHGRFINDITPAINESSRLQLANQLKQPTSWRKWNPEEAVMEVFAKFPSRSSKSNMVPANLEVSTKYCIIAVLSLFLTTAFAIFF